MYYIQSPSKYSFSVVMYCLQHCYSLREYSCWKHSWKPWVEIVFAAVPVSTNLDAFFKRHRRIHCSLTSSLLQHVQYFWERFLQTLTQFDIRTFFFNFWFRGMRTINSSLTWISWNPAFRPYFFLSTSQLICASMAQQNSFPLMQLGDTSTMSKLFHLNIIKMSPIYLILQITQRCNRR